IDSPVAGKLLQEQGIGLEAVHFSLEPFTDAGGEQKAAALAKKIGLPRLHVVPAGPLFGDIVKRADQRLYFVLSKRLMARVAGATLDAGEKEEARVDVDDLIARGLAGARVVPLA